MEQNINENLAKVTSLKNKQLNVEENEANRLMQELLTEV